MKRLLVAAATACLLALIACRSESAGAPSPIVGAWFVTARGAPFPYHVFTFNADGTMQQANPDAGDPNTSDSDGMGVWTAAGDHVKGKFVEVTADRATHAFVSRGEISFEISVRGDTFTGTATGRFFDESGALVRGPVGATLEGRRIRPD